MKIKKFLFKSTCVALSAVMLSTAIPVFAKTEDNISITNPYANIDWADINQYKTALHTHTNASDGDIALRASLERHYETGFDVVAITDHGTVDYDWREFKGSPFVGKAMKLFGRSDFALDYLGESGEFSKGTKYQMIKKGSDDYLVTDDGREILRIPYGIENNALSVNAHVNSWFADFSRNLPSDYIDAVRGVEKAGGLSVINHPGEYSTARYELYQEDAYNLNNPAYKYFFQKIYGMVNEYDSCLGLDINSKGDDRTRYDRKLWDLMLTEAAKSGKTVYAIASSDAHQLNKIDTGFTYILAKNKTSADIRAALENGEFFAASTCLHNCDELEQIAASIKDFYGETELYFELSSIVAEYKAKREELSLKAKKSNVGFRYDAIDDEGYFDKATRPAITAINVDDNENTIKIKSENALIVRWISDGKLIATTKASDGKIDLDDFEGQLGDYVRAEVFGEGGVIYTQSFTLNAEQKTEQKFCYVNLGFFDFIIPDINLLVQLVARGIKGLFN